TAANMIALQNHQIVPYAAGAACDLRIDRGSTPWYCMNAITPTPLNNTPYWIMQLPQVFVPDHSTVFQDYLLQLISAVMQDSKLTATCAPTLAPGVAPPQGLLPPPPLGRPRLKKTK